MADKTIRVTLTLDNGKRKVTEFNPKKLPLVFLEALGEIQEDSSWKHMRAGLRQLLNLSEKESLQLTTDHFQQIMDAVSGAQDIPNESA